MDIDLATIVISHMDVSPINRAIQQRAEALASQLRPEAAEQFLSDFKSYSCNAALEGDEIAFTPEVSESYLIEYLKDHGTPVAGGDNGTAHNVDGSTYESRVPEKFWGTPLPWLELPTIDGKEEVSHVIQLMAGDAIRDSVNRSNKEIKDIAYTYFRDKLSEMLGGDS